MGVYGGGELPAHTAGRIVSHEPLLSHRLLPPGTDRRVRRRFGSLGSVFPLKSTAARASLQNRHAGAIHRRRTPARTRRETKRTRGRRVTDT
jgi:hypothetical protein